MRKKIVAANWKMNNTFSESVDLINEINGLLKQQPNNNTTIILAPPFPFLQIVVELTKNNPNIFIAGQNCHSEEKGAYTGEIAAKMLHSIGAKYVIIGHSERRAYFNEDNHTLSKKIDATLNSKLFPIYCCGEKLQEREANNQFEVVKKQIEEGLFHLSDEKFINVVIAYEPVWAIGTGVNAAPEQAQEIHAHIRNIIAVRYGKKIADNTSILYGGSCKPDNASVLFTNPDVDGGLIGGASLIADDFVKIINSF